VLVESGKSIHKSYSAADKVRREIFLST